MRPPQQSAQSVRSRNQANTRRNAVKVDQYLIEVEKVHGYARAWALRERLERGDVTLAELGVR